MGPLAPRAGPAHLCLFGLCSLYLCTYPCPALLLQLGCSSNRLTPAFPSPVPTPKSALLTRPKLDSDQLPFVFG